MGGYVGWIAAVAAFALAAGCFGGGEAGREGAGAGSGADAAVEAGTGSGPGPGADSGAVVGAEAVGTENGTNGESGETAGGSGSGADGKRGDGAAVDVLRGEYRVLADGLETPWAIDFAGEIVYVSERGGSVVRIGPEGDVARKPVRLEKDVFVRGEAGFLGFALAPDFERSGTAYAYHTYQEAGEIRNRIVALEERDDAWVETNALLEGIPGGAIHDGGRLAFGPDGRLYATTGDAGDEPLAQDPNSLAGKLLRMTADGKVPEDNPFAGSYVYSYGHRNPQGFAWNDAGELYASEHGPSGRPGGHDEINRIEPGKNYGWPLVYGDARREGTVPPSFHTGDPAIAPSGVAFDAAGGLLVAALRGEALFRFDPSDGSMEKVVEGEGRLRDVKARDGRVYAITNNTDGRGSPGPDDDRLLVWGAE